MLQNCQVLQPVNYQQTVLESLPRNRNGFHQKKKKERKIESQTENAIPGKNAVLKTKQTQFVGVQTHIVKLEIKVSMIEKSFIVNSEKEESGTREAVTSKGIRYPVNPGGA